MARVYQITIVIKEHEEEELCGLRIWGGCDRAGLEDDLPFLKPYRRVVYKDWHDAAKAMDEIVHGIEDKIREWARKEEAPIELTSTIPTADGIDITAQLENEKITLSVCATSLEVL